MLERELERVSRALRNLARAEASRLALTAARKRAGAALKPTSGAPTLIDAMLWGFSRWGQCKWGPPCFEPRPVSLSGRWGRGRWGYLFWRRARVRVR